MPTKDNLPAISVLGAGYVGLTTAVLFANTKFKVYLLETNTDRIKTIKNGKSFFYEKGLNPLIKYAIKSGNLTITDAYADAIPGSKFVFSCVGTPDNPDGSSNLNYVFGAAREAMIHMNEGAVFVQKSTVPVGTGQEIEKTFVGAGKKIKYVSNPEFLREGTAISDTLWPDRIVSGSNDVKNAEIVLSLYRTLLANRQQLAKRAGIETGANQTSYYFSTSLASAELIKVTANAFLALKISFANSIAMLADKTGADINEVMDAVGTDKRIGRAFLNAGRGYGGGCFPKDVRGLIKSAEANKVDLPIMVAADRVNESMPDYIVDKAVEQLGSIKGKKMAILGLSFKAGTSDARKSPGVKIANILQGRGAIVSAYDPEAMKEAKVDLKNGISLANNVAVAVNNSDAIFITTDWQEFKDIDLPKLKPALRRLFIVDCMNVLDRESVLSYGFQYIGVGR